MIYFTVKNQLER